MNTFWPELKAVSRIRVSQVCIQFRELGGIVVIAQGSHASWKVLVFFFKIPGPGKSWENHFGPGKSWKNILGKCT